MDNKLSSYNSDFQNMIYDEEEFINGRYSLSFNNFIPLPEELNQAHYNIITNGNGICIKTLFTNCRAF